MIIVLLAILLFYGCSHGVPAGKPRIFDALSDGLGYHNYRIPSLLITSSGTLLAVAEGRIGKNIDHAENDLVLKRSTDNGKTWTNEQILVSDGRNCCMNPTMVQSQDGKILLVYIWFPAKYHTRTFIDDSIHVCEPGYEGEKIERVFFIESSDDGLTWTSPRELTTIAKKSSRTIAAISGPGTGIVLTRGKHKGRLIIPMCDRRPDTDSIGSGVYALFSDNNGLTWRTGDFAPSDTADNLGTECQMVELESGDVLVNCRVNPATGFRKTAISKDGGFTWSPLTAQPELADIGCMGSILRYRWKSGDTPGIIIYSGSTERIEGKKRGRGTIWISFDDGITWPVKKVIHPGPFDYSCLAKMQDGTVVMLAEYDFDGERLKVCLEKFGPDQLLK